MTPVTKRIYIDRPVIYRMMLQGRLPERWDTIGDETQIEHSNLADGTAVSFLTFKATDQSALHGVLNQIRDLDLPLLSLEILD